MNDSQAAPAALGATEPAEVASFPTCCGSDPQNADAMCHRRPEWRIAAVDHDGATIRAWLACSEHRGQASAAAWRVEPAIVEIRQYVEVAA